MANKEATAVQKKTLNPFKNKKLKYGGLSVLFTVIFIVGVVLVNVIITLLGERFSVEADLTDAGLFTIEDTTKEYLSGITDEVIITVTSEESAFTANGTEFNQTNEILKKIANSSSNITLQYVDVISNPGFLASYEEDITQMEIVVESKGTKRVEVLDSNEYFHIIYNEQYLQMGYQVPESVEANCEQAVVSAIMSVTDTDPVKVAVLTGYGETTNATVETLLTTNSYVLEDVNITLVENIGDEYDFVFIFGPDKDYSTEDVDKLARWLDNDGNFGKNLIYVNNPSLGESPHIDSLLADWGLKIEKGTLYQTDTNYAYESRRTYQMLQLNETVFDEMQTQGYFFGDNMSPVTLLWEGYGNMATSAVLSTYDGATIMPQNSGDNWEPADNAEKKAYPVIAQSLKIRYVGTDPLQSRIMAFGGMELLTNTFLTSPSTNNAQLLMNIFNVSCNKEAGITLTPKSYESTTFEITESQKKLLTVIFVGALPAVLFASGVVVWLRRKHK